MKIELVRQLGKKAFVQSIKPYKGGVFDSVEVFGLDTEYVPHKGAASDLVSWQLAHDGETLFTQKPLTKDNLMQEVWRMLGGKVPSAIVIVTFFAIAELQFFNLSEWLISEFKGKYRLETRYKDVKTMVMDLADWYQHIGLEAVAKQWGFEKVSYPIGEKMEAIERGEYTVAQLVKEPEFRHYAVHDADITQRIYKGLRQFFLDNFGVDTCMTLTPANTSASIMRKGMTEAIGQPDTELRQLALKACWGGRMECFYRGTVASPPAYDGFSPAAFEYDVTGHHPNSALALGVLPLPKDWHKTTSLRTWTSGISGVGKVFFEFPPETQYPCLPVMAPDALIFPLTGTSYCTVSEVRLALEMGAKVYLAESGYWFGSGTDLLQRHLLRLQTMRNATQDEAARALLKLQSNGVIGKFFQKNQGVDIGKVQAFAEENGIPLDVAMKMKGEDFASGFTVGSCFYPEWYSAILGYARYSIARTASAHAALVISSDSFVTTEYLGEEFDTLKLHFSVKSRGDYVGYRTRFYRVGEKIAHHAVHSRDAGKEVLKEFKEGKYHYTAKRFTHLRESLRTGKPFGARIERPMSTDLCFDYKRVLLPDGTTKAWPSLEARMKFMENEPVYDEDKDVQRQVDNFFEVAADGGKG